MSWRACVAIAAVALLPPAALATTASVAAAPAPRLSRFATTVIAGGATSGGAVGASGGLVTVDSGSAYVRARLDSGPSSAVLADVAEPGSLARTLVGQSVGQQTLPIPGAEAQYPGRGSATSEPPVPPTPPGPLSSGSGTASAHADATSAVGQSDASSFGLAGVYQGTGSSTLATLRRTGDDLSASATSGVAGLTVGGALSVANVSGTAKIRLTAGKRTAEAGVTVGSASVNKVPVVIDGDGVHAAPLPLIPLGPAQQTTEQLNQQLRASGIEVHVIAATRTVTSSGAFADSGGLVITVTTAPLPGGVAANTMTLYIGRVVETESDSTEAPVAAVNYPVAVPPQTTTTTIVTAGDTGTPGSDAPPPAAAAGTDSPLTRLVTIAGRRLTVFQVVVAFGLWQLLSMGAPTLTTLVRRRRRQRLQAVAL